MEQESFVFGSLTLVMLVGVLVLLAGVAELGNTVVVIGTFVAMASVVGMGLYLSRMESPEGASH